MTTQAPVNVSPLIRGARWTFLITGFAYGVTRLSMLKRTERKRLAELERTRPEREAKLAAEKKRREDAEMKELENMMSGTSPA